MPRDPKRIDAALLAVWQFWVKHDDWRLGQLIENAAFYSHTTSVSSPIFYIEDDELVHGIDVMTRVLDDAERGGL